MIPKKIHYCWFGKKKSLKWRKNVSQVGKNIVQIMN